MYEMSLDDLEKIRQGVREDLKRAKITVHTGTCGIAAGARKVMDAILKELNKNNIDDVIVTTSGCIGLCNREPIITVELKGELPIKYVGLTPERISRIISEHVIGGEVVKEFALEHEMEINFFSHQIPIVLKNRGLINPESIDEYIAHGGYKALGKALTSMTSEEIISEIKKSGLRGRGGAGFPTGEKWEICKRAPGDTKYVICNADEGNPGAYVDRSIIESDPYTVLEGMTIGARAIGAGQGFIYIRSEYPFAIEILELAIEKAKNYGLIGKNILNTDFSFQIHIKQGAGAFICGEETALIASIEGYPPEPRTRPPFPTLSGLWEKPTVINNVETWGNIPSIINYGAQWFASIGTEKSKGTKVFSLAGKINNTGMVEVPMGISLREIIFQIGGGIPGDKKLKAVQTGGPLGGFLPASLIDIPVDYEKMMEAGATMGSGGIVIMDEDNCMVDITRFIMDFARNESCGKCTPCREGSIVLYEILERICNGEGKEEDLVLMEEMSYAIKDASICGLGKSLPEPILSVLRHFKDEFEIHIKEKKCPAKQCKYLI